MSIRVDRILRVADAIEASHIGARKIEFNMKTWGRRTWKNECGTAACVAGWAVGIEALEQKQDPEERIWYLGDGSRETWATAQYWLGLDTVQARAVFYPSDYMMEHINDNASLVPDALRYMAMSGDYSWHDALLVARCVRELPR